MNRISKGHAFVLPLVLFVFIASQVSAQQTILEVKDLPVGSVITTTGIITTGPEWGQIRYMQDHVAGIAIFSADLEERVPGDSILITGVLSEFRGQLQIAPVLTHQLIEKVSVPEPVITSASDPLLADYFSMKVSFYCLGLHTCKKLIVDAPYRGFDNHGREILILFPEPHDLIGDPVDFSPVNITGILSNRDERTTLLVEFFASDTQETCSLIYPGSTNPESGIVQWVTQGTGKYFVEYGQTGFDKRVEVLLSSDKVEFLFDTLEKGNIYKARLMRESQDTTISPPVYFSPKNANAPAIQFFFNKNLDTSYSDGSMPDGTGASAIAEDIISRIDNVQYTLEIAMYNTTNDGIVQAVERAVQRGVVVRYIADDETSNSALTGITDFPVFYRTGSGLMHHKFVIGDALTEQAWVWTGSTNFSSGQLFSDPNNALIITDKSIAENYLIEFNELWGEDPDHEDAKSGEAKLDNSAHLFQSGQTLIESYFSPSDETACRIIDALQTADEHVEIGLLLLTKEDMINEIISIRQRGVGVRLIVDDATASSDAIEELENWGVQIKEHHYSQIFHHKYAIIDEGELSSDPIVITGSHNWTFSADRINDENTVIIHDQRAANLYRQEFEARWAELGNTSTVTPESNFFKVTPNPANEFIEISNPSATTCTVSLMDLNGSRKSIFTLEGQFTTRINLVDFIPGVYILKAQIGDDIVVERFVVSGR